MTTYRNIFIVIGSCSSLLGVAMACAPPAPGGSTSAPNPTLQTAATAVGGAAGAVATAQGGIAQPTTAAAQTQIVTSGQSAATAVAPTVESGRTAVTTAVAGQATEVAPTISAARTEIAPTAAAAGTTVAGAGAAAQVQQATSVTVAREATATALAPTAQAVATHVAPTVQASATQVVSAVGTSVTTSTVHVTNVNVGTADTMVSIQNSGAAPVSLAGWTLVMGPNLSLVLGDITVKPGQTRVLHFSQGADTDSDVYIGFGTPVAPASLQPGARVVLIAPPDQIASIFPIT